MTVATRGSFTGGAPDGLAGSWTPDGSPQGIETGSTYASFPGICRLDADSLLEVDRDGTDHLADGVIKGRIGSLSGTSVTWGSAFTIHSDSDDVRVDDALEIIDDQVVLAGRLYDGTDNHSPFLLICDDAPASLTSSSTWTEVSIPLTSGTNENLATGHAVKRGDGGYLVPYVQRNTDFLSGVLLSESLTDWSSMTEVVVGAESGEYSEICVEVMADGELIALLRSEADGDTYRAVSTDHGLTWTTPVLAHDGYGLPMFRVLPGGTFLTVYRKDDADTYWRTSTDEGATWSSETLLDSNGTRNVYATLLVLDSSNALCVYAIENSGSDADIYSQVFTRA